MNLLTYLLEQTARWAFVFPQERRLQRAIALAFGILCGVGRRTLTRALSFHGNTQKDGSADDKRVLRKFPQRAWPQTWTGGRRRQHSAAPLFRVHLLSLLTPVHSLNLVVRLLPEQSGWRRFARLRNQDQRPDVRMLHEFRARTGVAGLRAINAHLLEPLSVL